MIFKKRSCGYWLVVLVALFASFFNIAHVMVGAFQTPSGNLNLWTGHYYADYFAYVQTMVQGSRGKWLVENCFATDDPSRTFLAWWPDLFLGKLGGVLGIPPFVFYWLAVAVFSFLLMILIFLTLQKLLSEKPFYFQFAVFLITIFAAPFFKIVKEGGIELIPYDFWYAPSKIFERLGRVPRHLLDQIFGVGVFLIVADAFSKINNLSLKKLWWRGLAVAFLTGVILTFSYLAIILLGVIFLAGMVLLARDDLFEKRFFRSVLPLRLQVDPSFSCQTEFPAPSRAQKVLLFLTIVFSIGFPVGLAVYYLSGFSGVMVRAAAWDTSQQLRYPLAFILLTTGPILFFVPFGIVKYFRRLTTARLLAALVFFVSWGFYFLPIAPFFKTSNARFLTPLSYLFLGTSAGLGIEVLANFKPKLKRRLIFGMTGALLLLFWPSNYFFFQRWMYFDPNLTYLPRPVYESLLFLDSLPGKKAVLTAPTGYLGSYLPIFVDKKVYLGREFYTPNFESKKILASEFYNGKMGEIEAKNFLADNGIGYVVWRKSDSYPLEILGNYPFLRPAIENQQSAIFEFKDE